MKQLIISTICFSIISFSVLASINTGARNDYKSLNILELTPNINSVEVK